MVNFTSSLFVAALIAAPVFASATWDELDSRDISEQPIFGRELAETEAVYARELDELFARVSDDLAARGDVDFEDLVERNKAKDFFKKLWGGIKKVASFVIRSNEGKSEVFARDAGEFDSREVDELFERYIDEIEERTPGFFDFLKHGMSNIKAIAHKDDKPAETDLEVREFEDFFERELEELSERDIEEPAYAREYELDLLQREFEQDLLEREIDELD